MRISLILIILLHIFINCSAKKNVVSSTKRDTIVIIFNKFPKFPRIVEIVKGVTFGNSLPFITITDNFHNISYEPDSSSDTDTLKIKPEGEYVLLRHTFNIISVFDYLLKEGDTLVLSYVDKIPIGTILNRKIKEFDLNYEMTWRQQILTNDHYISYEIYLNPFLSNKNNNGIQTLLSERNNTKKEYYLLAKKTFIKEKTYLDSLKNQDKISAECYNFYSNKVKYLLAKLDIEQHVIMADSISKILPPGDSLTLPYSYYYNFIESFVEMNIVKKAPTINSPNGSIADYRIIFDKLYNQNIKSPYKKILLYKYLKLIGDNFSITDLEAYFKKFSRETNDSFLLNDINANYFFNYSKVLEASGSVYLMNIEKKVLTLSNFINANRGKVIYVDFWASWCLPCRESMQKMKIIRNKYKEDKIVIIYLSIDKNADNWKKAALAEDIFLYSENYLVINPSYSKYLKTLKVDEIPRYFLYDKMGNLVHSNAPGPNSSQLPIEINKLLLK